MLMGILAPGSIDVPTHLAAISGWLIVRATPSFVQEIGVTEFGEPIAATAAIAYLEHANQPRTNRELVVEVVRCVIDRGDDDVHSA